MNPFFIRNRIHPYLDGELSEQDRAEMEHALTEHPEILEELEELDFQRLFLQEQGQEQAPANLLSEILKEIDQEPTGKAITGAANNLHWYLLSALALALFAVLLPRKSEQSAQLRPEIKSARSLPIPNIIELPPRDIPLEINAPSTISPPKEKKKTKTSRRKNTPSKQSLNFVIGTPEHPYTATWEGSITHTIEPVLLEEQQDSYQLRLAKEDILFRLQSIAEASSGQLTSTSGERLEPFRLNGENGFQVVNIVVPQQNYSTIDENLRQLGATTSLQTLPVIDGTVRFPVAVYYQFY